MDKDILRFIKDFTKEVHESNAAIFAGAGLSMPAGFVNWKNLMRDIADEIGLDVDKESDLIAIAQYHINEKQGRGKINQMLIDEFTKETEITENHKILARLPIETFWTTNYDKLIEDSLKSEGKRVDIKINKENMANSMPGRNSVVYKMHGDISNPHEAVLAKDDYVDYNANRQVFTTALQGDLVSKTFLFVGFSFDDPNLDYILNRIRVLLGNNQRRHYCFMKKVLETDYMPEKKEDYFYNKGKQKLVINDLKRYGIQVLLIDEYEEITTILKMVEDNVKRKNIFISGSAHEYGDWEESAALSLANKLSKRIIKNGNNVVTGFGLGIGSSVLSGAMEELYSKNTYTIESRLLAKPFPQPNANETDFKKLWTRHRKIMIEKVGIAIFLFGNKEANGTIIDADGMLEEFHLSIDEGVVPIPIGCTGYMAKKIWDVVMEDFNKYVSDSTLKGKYEQLNKENQTPEEIIELVISIITALEIGKV